jgi:pilus assembly protein Flp/PilA
LCYAAVGLLKGFSPIFYKLLRKKEYNIVINRFIWICYPELSDLLGKEELVMLFSLKERGQGMVEYALILVLVAIVVIAALTLMGPLVRNIFSTINASL